VAPGGETLTISYDFFPFTSIPVPKTYQLQLAVFYSDSIYEYTDIVYGDLVHVEENEQQVGLISGFLSLTISALVVFLIGFVIYVKITDRFMPGSAAGGERKRKSNGLLDNLRDLISSRGAQGRQ
jgi:hypothetical protein